MNNSSNNSITALVPGGVVTTQNISTVIKPRSNNNSMQFVKIQTPELSKKAVEQIRVAQESKITKDKIHETEEEWQSNLLNWKSKRRQQFVGQHDQVRDGDNNEHGEGGDNGAARKIKTFAEMIEQRAKKGNRLNFHLERYIGSGDDEDDDGVDNVDDGDDDRDGDGDGDGVSESSQSILGDSHSVSVVASAEADQLNSTLKQGIDKPPTPPIISSNGRPKPILDVDTRTNEVSAKSEPENDPSVSDEDDEERDYEERVEQEEQKQLQRNAFEAKLKAFERMTQPTLQEPKFAPVKPISRSVKAPKPTIVDAIPRVANANITTNLTSRVSNLQLNSEPSCNVSVTPPPPPLQPWNQSPEQSSSPPEPLLRQLTPPSNSNSIDSPQSNSIENQTIQLQQQQQQQQVDHWKGYHSSVESISPKISPGNYSNNNNIISNNSESIISPSLFDCAQPNPLLSPQLSKQKHAYISPVTQKLTPPPPPVQMELFQTRDILEPNSMVQSKMAQTTPTSGVCPQTVALIDDNLSLNHRISSNNSIQSQPLPEPTKMNSRLQPIVNNNNININNNNNNITLTHQPRKPAPREDKDRTVLSVSGKKRCSSCKEELGRGAAAFVVESLSLVYHTNCFRCSVCHVNLSNGFRGVDVRVHAGALHCQNCYSKDGLNYSRV